MTTPITDPAARAEVWQLRHYDEKAAAIATGLRELADRVERAASPYPTAASSGTPRHLYAAEATLNELAWGLANLGPHRLIAEAYLADQAETKPTEESTP